MSLDVVDLRNFYAEQLGTLARRFIGLGIRSRWPDTRGQRVVGLGYTTPYLGLFRDEAERCLAFMPAAQGVIKWPSARPALAALVEEYDLPLPDLSVDRLVLVHALEMSDDAPSLLRELWRVLAPGGRLLLVIPNRRGSMGAHGHDAVRPRPALFALADFALAAGDIVHPDVLGGSALHAADRPRLALSVGGRLGARRPHHLGAVRRRPHRRGDEAGVPRDPGPPRKAPLRPRAGARACAVPAHGAVERARSFAPASA